MHLREPPGPVMVDIISPEIAPRMDAFFFKNLLQETETLLFDQADWKQKFRLRYRECLHE